MTLKSECDHSRVDEINNIKERIKETNGREVLDPLAETKGTEEMHEAHKIYEMHEIHFSYGRKMHQLRIISSQKQTNTPKLGKEEI